MDEILVIFNPAARSEKARRVLRTIGQLSGSIMRATAAAGDALTLAKWGVDHGYKTIVAAGGDGTINEVVNGLAGADVRLGILPIGTMNVFASELGIPTELARAWKVIEAGHVRRIDLARANTHYFVQLAGVGLDAQVVQATSWNLKKNFGPLSYVIAAAQIAAQKPPRLFVEADGETHEGSFVLVGNGRYYGGPFAFFSRAQIDDGKLDILIFRNLGYLDIARYLGGILTGTHTDLPDVRYFQTKRASVSSEVEVPVELDGELEGLLPVTFRISSRKLSVLTPEPALSLR